MFKKKKIFPAIHNNPGRYVIHSTQPWGINQDYCIGLYSGRAVHFWTEGAPILTKFFLVLQYMKKLRSSPSEQFLVIRVCQKWQKCKISEKPGFWRNCGYISKTVRSIIMIFWHKTPLTINKRMAKKKFKFFFHFWEKIN